MHCSAQCLRLLLLLTCLRCARSGCFEIVSVILSIEEDSTSHSGCSASDANISHIVCSDLQSALDLLATNSSSNCWDASVVLLAGQNVLESPVYLSTYSLLLTGSGPGSTIVCRPFECETTAGQHSIYFNHSRWVRIMNLSSEHCPCPFRFDSVVNVSVQRSSFGLAVVISLYIHVYIKIVLLSLFNCKTSVSFNSQIFMYENKRFGYFARTTRCHTSRTVSHPSHTHTHAHTHMHTHMHTHTSEVDHNFH